MVMARLGVKTDTSGPRDQADRAANFGLWPTSPHTGNEWAAGVTATPAAYSLLRAGYSSYRPPRYFARNRSAAV
jgi:hypothetical protein